MMSLDRLEKLIFRFKWYLGGLCELDGRGAAVRLCLAAKDGHTRVHQMLPTRQAPAGHDRSSGHLWVQKLDTTTVCVGGVLPLGAQVMTKVGGGCIEELEGSLDHAEGLVCVPGLLQDLAVQIHTTTPTHTDTQTQTHRYTINQPSFTAELTGRKAPAASGSLSQGPCT
jgi:hypothetical protein